MTPSIASDLIERLDEYRRAEAYVGEFCATDEQWPDVLEARDEALVALYPHVPAIVEALSQLTREVDELRAAIAPFIEAGAHGVAVADAVRAANLPKAGLSPLMCPEIPAGVSAAQDRISFADWKSVAALSRSSGRVSDAE